MSITPMMAAYWRRVLIHNFDCQYFRCQKIIDIEYIEQEQARKDSEAGLVR